MDISDLNPQQKSAVLDSLDNNTVVIAGAGSGKTKTLTKRVGYIVDDLGVDPSNLMVVTFTNKAANEIIERITNEGIDVSDMWIGTFHSVCVKILKKFGSDIGIDYFSIIDSYTAKKTIKSIVFDKMGQSNDSIVNNIIARISYYKCNMINTNKAYEIAENDYERKVAEIYKEYQRNTWEKRTFDFDDLIIYTIVLLTRSRYTLEWFNDNIKYIMCDESQDTNVSQFSLLKMLVGPNNLFLVGDDSQSIYGFRQAKPEYLLNFTSMYADSKVIMLEQNYRSTKTIVNASNAVIENNKSRYKKNAFSENDVGDPIIYHLTANPQQEADWIASEIAITPISLNDIVILYRTNAQSRVIEEALLKIGIPHKLVGAQSFYDRKEIKDILSFVKFIANPNDEISFTRALSTMKGIGKKTIEKIIEESKVSNMSFLDSIKQFGAKPKQAVSLNKFVNIIENAKVVGQSSVSDMVKYIVTSCGIIDDLNIEGTGEAMSRIENIKELINVSVEQDNKNKNLTVEDFVLNIALLSATKTDDKKEAVNLMTIHSSKGLEFKTVYIAGLEEGILPHRNSKTPDAIEEERRLMYVAMTRAKDNLFLSSCKERRLEGINDVERQSPSRFLSEIPKRYLCNI